MKKILTTCTLLLLAATPIVITACDEDDEDIAYTLNSDGRDYWRGNMQIQYHDRYGTTYETTYTEVEFRKYGDTWASGDGYWVDYYSNAPWDYQAFHIDWKVRDEVIRIHFREDNTSVDIEDYHLSDRFFEGYIYMRNERVHFKLERRRWSDYHYWDDRTWYDNDYDHFYYAKPQAGSTVTEQEPYRSLAVE